VGLDSSVGIATRYGLDGLVDRIPVETRFSASVQNDPGAHPPSYKMGTVSFPGVKLPGCEVDHPPPYSDEVKERGELYVYSRSGPSWPVIGWPLPLLLYHIATCFELFLKKAVIRQCKIFEERLSHTKL